MFLIICDQSFIYIRSLLDENKLCVGERLNKLSKLDGLSYPYLYTFYVPNNEGIKRQKAHVCQKRLGLHINLHIRAVLSESFTVH